MIITFLFIVSSIEHKVRRSNTHIIFRGSKGIYTHIKTSIK